jgi:hypothetical protein
LITFDRVKRAKTLAERGLNFQRAKVVFEGRHLTRIDDRRDYGEQRFITAGRLDERIVGILWTPRGRARRTWRDPEDAPELTDEWIAGANLYAGKKLVRRGRPAGTAKKTQTTVRISNEVLAYFRSSGRGWQTRMDAALKKYAASPQR